MDEYKIFNMSISNFDNSDHSNALYLVYTYLIRNNKSGLQNETIFKFLVKELASRFYIGNGNNTKIWENLNISLIANPDITQVITHLSGLQDQDEITNNRAIIKPIVEKTLHKITEENKKFNTSSIMDFLNTNHNAIFCGASNFPDLFRERTLSKAGDKDLYFSFKTFCNPSTNEPCNVPKGTLNYICARPSAGKTTALISLTLESLENNRTVVFITTEETPDSLYIKLIKAHFFKHNKTEYKTKWHEIIGKQTQKFFETQLPFIFQDDLRPAHDTKEELFLSEIRKAIKESESAICNYFKSGKLYFSDACEYTSWNDTLEVMHKAKDGGIVFLDYIQHLPKMPIDKASLLLTSRLDQLRETSRQILEECKRDNLICFAGAQMKRESDNQKTNAPLLSMEYIRECSDFEQDAHLIIGLGRKGDTRFYNVMKYRDEEYNDNLYIELDREDGHFGYSYILPAYSDKRAGHETLMLYKLPEKPKGNETSGSGTKPTTPKKNTSKSGYLQGLMQDQDENE